MQYRYVRNIGAFFFHFLQEKEKIMKKIDPNIQRFWLLLGKCIMPSNRTFGSRYSGSFVYIFQMEDDVSDKICRAWLKLALRG